MITAIIGDNFYSRRQQIAQIKNSFTQGNTDFSVEQFDASEVEYQKILDSVQNISLFSEDKLVIIYNFDASKDLMEKIETFFAAVPSGVGLVLVAEKVDKRTAAYAAIKKTAKIIECTQPSSLQNWIIDEVKRRNGSISPANAQFLIDRLGPNQTLLAQEIEKLLLFESTISKESIELLTVAIPQSSMFQLLDAAFTGKKEKVMSIYKEQREMKVEPLAIVGMITWQLFTLALVKSAEQTGITNIAKEANLNPYVVSKTQQLAKGRTLAMIRNMMKNLLALEVRLKTQPIDSDDALQLFLLTELS